MSRFIWKEFLFFSPRGSLQQKRCKTLHRDTEERLESLADRGTNKLGNRWFDSFRASNAKEGVHAGKRAHPLLRWYRVQAKKYREAK